jgi:hypothetical protein
VRSARPRSRRLRPLARGAAVGACLVAIGAGAAGCETTQEKAAKQQARAAHILGARAARQKERKAREKSPKHRKEGKQ